MLVVLKSTYPSTTINYAILLPADQYVTNVVDNER